MVTTRPQKDIEIDVVVFPKHLKNSVATITKKKGIWIIATVVTSCQITTIFWVIGEFRVDSTALDVGSSLPIKWSNQILKRNVLKLNLN
jgi:hypothetical protein